MFYFVFFCFNWFFQMAKATYAKKAFVSLLPRGQWVCDKSRAFCGRKEKRRHPHFGVFSYLIGVFPQKNNIKLGNLHDKREIIL